MAQSMPDVIARVFKARRISDDDVLAMRREVYPDGVIQPDEAERLFRLNDECPEQSPAWTTFFVEAITDFLVNQVDPPGYVSEDNATWLINHISRKGLVSSSSEMELLVKVLEEATSAPERLERFALEQVKSAVLTGSGAARAGSELLPFRISAAEVDLLRRILYACGGDGGAAITRTEADLLFDINDAVGNADNHPSWSDLFVKAIANYLMAASDYKAPSRQEALKLEKWEDDDRVSTVDFFSRALSGGLRGILAAYSKDVSWDERLKQQQDDITSAEHISDGEAKWLIGRINRSGGMQQNERQLLRFIAAESPDIHPLLKPLVAQAA